MMQLFSLRTNYHKNGTQFIGKLGARIMGESNYEWFRMEKRIFYGKGSGSSLEVHGCVLMRGKAFVSVVLGAQSILLDSAPLLVVMMLTLRSDRLQYVRTRSLHSFAPLAVKI